MNRFIPLWTLISREVVRIFRIWTQTLFPPILTSSLFILIFGYSLGSRISEVGGVSYLEFILPGLLMMGVINTAYHAPLGSLFLRKFQKSIQEILVAPLSYWHIIISYMVASLVRSLIVGAGILLIALFITPISIYNLAILLYFCIMTILLFSFAGILTALWAEDFEQLNSFLTFLITPLTYLGGVFYSVEMLPTFWQGVAKFNPILYLIDGFRYGFLGMSDFNILYSGIFLFVLVVVFFFICVHLFRIGYKIRS